MSAAKAKPAMRAEMERCTGGLVAMIRRTARPLELVWGDMQSTRVIPSRKPPSGCYKHGTVTGMPVGDPSCRELYLP